MLLDLVAERIKGCEDAWRVKQEKDEHNAAQLAKMRDEARGWPGADQLALHWSGRVSSSALRRLQELFSWRNGSVP